LSERVELEISDGVAHVRMNRPEKKNALDAGMFEGLIGTARQLMDDRSVRSVVLSGAGDCFSAGLDVSSIGAMAQGDLSGNSDEIASAARDLSRDGAHRGQQIAWLWQEVPVPVIAAVQGVAYGGGLHIALGADIRLVAPDARIAFVEITWGLVPDLSGTQALRRLVPLALGLARVIAQRSPDAVRAAKKLLNASALVPVSDGLANEFRCSTELMGGKNQIEAVMSKLEKRPPRFVDPD
jgi:enoyl-CoA hydratase/carnithine racemase